MNLTNEAKLKDLLTSLENINDDLNFQIKHTAKLAAIHDDAKKHMKYLKECKEEKMERIKKLEAEI